MDNSINFKGAFLIQKPTASLRENIFPLLGKRKQIIENVSKSGDVLYVVRDKFDKGIADFLLKADNVKFKYYPTLNTKSGFDDEKPQEAKNILTTARNKVISTVKKLENHFKPKLKKPVDIEKIQRSNLDAVQKKLLIDITGSDYRTNIDHQTGICSVYTTVRNYRTGKDERHALISITPPGIHGISYARYTPITEYQGLKRIAEDKSMRRFAVRNNEIIFEYTQPASKVFMENSSAAKKYYADTLAKYNEDLATLKSE